MTEKIDRLITEILKIDEGEFTRSHQSGTCAYHEKHRARGLAILVRTLISQRDSWIRLAFSEARGGSPRGAIEGSNEELDSTLAELERLEKFNFKREDLQNEAALDRGEE